MITGITNQNGEVVGPPPSTGSCAVVSEDLDHALRANVLHKEGFEVREARE